jgi:hypothetical protein
VAVEVKKYLDKHETAIVSETQEAALDPQALHELVVTLLAVVYLVKNPAFKQSAKQAALESKQA